MNDLVSKYKGNFIVPPKDITDINELVNWLKDTINEGYIPYDVTSLGGYYIDMNCPIDKKESLKAELLTLESRLEEIKNELENK